MSFILKNLLSFDTSGSGERQLFTEDKLLGEIAVTQNFNTVLGFLDDTFFEERCITHGLAVLIVLTQYIKVNGRRLLLRHLESGVFDVGLFAGTALFGEDFPNRIVATTKTGTDTRTGARLLSLAAATRKCTALSSASDAA